MSVRLLIALAIFVLLLGQLGILFALRRFHRSQKNREKSILREIRQLRALTNVRPMLGDSPLSLGGWAIEPDFAELLVDTIVAQRPTLIVECGSGASTILIGRCLTALGNGRLVSLEHDGRFVERTQALATAHDVLDRVEVRHTPLHANGSGGIWYHLEDGDLAMFSEGVDMIVVDGPPAGVAEQARYPVIPTLAPFIDEGTIVLLDDGDRPGERAIVDRWVRETRATATHVPLERGAWVVTGFQVGANT
jgi:predicted O-methyltransferase YrrM